MHRPLETYTHREIEIALVIWEHINEATLLPKGEHPKHTNDVALTALRDNVGTAELRYAALDLSFFVGSVLAKIDPDKVDGLAWDFEIVPAICRTITWGDGRTWTKLYSLPEPDAAAAEVMRALRPELLRLWTQDARSYAMRDYLLPESEIEDEWCAREFDAGSNAHEAVDALCEKFDIEPLGRTHRRVYGLG